MSTRRLCCVCTWLWTTAAAPHAISTSSRPSSPTSQTTWSTCATSHRATPWPPSPPSLPSTTKPHPGQHLPQHPLQLQQPQRRPHQLPLLPSQPAQALWQPPWSSQPKLKDYLNPPPRTHGIRRGRITRFCPKNAPHSLLSPRQTAANPRTLPSQNAQKHQAPRPLWGQYLCAGGQCYSSHTSSTIENMDLYANYTYTKVTSIRICWQNNNTDFTTEYFHRQSVQNLKWIMNNQSSRAWDYFRPKDFYQHYLIMNTWQ